MEERLKENSLRAQQKLDDTVGLFQAKIEKLEDDKKSELGKLDKEWTHRMEEREKSHKLEIEAQNQKLEMKVAQLEDQHKKEIERQDKRHQGQMQSLSKQVAYYKK